jgi:hypothetical protein
MSAFRSSVVVAVAAFALVFGDACSRTEPAPGVLMLAVQTDLAAGKDRDVEAGGLYVRDLFQLTEQVAPDGTVKFPATLAIVGRGNPGASVRIRVVGFKRGEAKVMREVVTTIPRDRVALLSLPLRWVNYDKTAGRMPAGGTGTASVHALAGEGEAEGDPANDRRRVRAVGHRLDDAAPVRRGRRLRRRHGKRRRCMLRHRAVLCGLGADRVRRLVRRAAAAWRAHPRCEASSRRQRRVRG